MVLPTLNAHATRPKILLKFTKFHWISPFCMVRSRKKQCFVSIFCRTLQCNRGTETIYLEPSKLSLDMSNLHGRATRRVVLESSFAQHFPKKSRRSYTKRWTLLTNHHFVIFKAPPTLIAHATRLKSLQISFRSVQSACHPGKVKHKLNAACTWPVGPLAKCRTATKRYIHHIPSLISKVDSNDAFSMRGAQKRRHQKNALPIGTATKTWNETRLCLLTVARNKLSTLKKNLLKNWWNLF